MASNRSFFALALAASLVFSLAWSVPARAQSEASLVLSALPVASVVAAASTAAVTLSVVPMALSTAGAVLLVKTVEVTARGTVYVLERASDGARTSVEVSGRAASAASVGVGTALAVGVIGTGVLLSAAGEVIAFIPNELGRALLYNERVTR